MLEDLAAGFFREVLELDYDDCVITDESSLWDFHGENDNEPYFRRIEEVYHVDVRDIASGNLADILERIQPAEPARPARSRDAFGG
ncbi:MAG TPA: hypothetical protein VFE05_01225 [Longimicrobiaceae bacterium]|jgi:hypothetical protein|nr:hypothetical protein [Longimicrobiaceae bacterium]